MVGSLGVIGSTWIDFGLLFVLVPDNGFIAILLMTWMQTRTPKEMLGRMMALLMTLWMALHPDLKGFSESLITTQAEGSGECFEAYCRGSTPSHLTINLAVRAGR